MAHTGDETNGSSRIQSLLARYVERLNVGDAVSVDELRREHPAEADELIEHLRLFLQAAADEPLFPGARTLGDYTLRRHLGSGGMGVVYEAWQNSVDRRVALKVLPPGVAADTRTVTRFIREAKTAARLDHPNVVSVYGMGVEADTPYYAMEFVEGATLAEVLARIQEARLEGETPFGRKGELAFYSNAACAFAGVADGLQHAHSKGVIHRDIKPSNLILDGEGRLRVLDFGLARLEGQESLTLSGDFLGTPQYMSPEQARRRKVPIDHRTDVYSLGATMYEGIAGRPPFRGKDHGDTLSQIIERDPVEPRKLNPRVPRDLETIVLKCLRKEAADRYGTAEALGQDLRRFVRGDPVEARPEGRWERWARRAWSQRQRLAIAFGAALVLLFACITAGVLFRRDRELTLAQYRTLVEEAISGIEVGVLTAPGQQREGETISLGLVSPAEAGLPGQIEAAAEKLEAALRLLPDRPEAAVFLYRAYRALGRWRDAHRALTTALRVNEAFLPALLLKAYALREEGRIDDAMRVVHGLRQGVREPWERDWLDAHDAAVIGDWDRVNTLYTKLIRERANSPPYVGFELELRLRRGRFALRRRVKSAAIHDVSYVRESGGGAAGPTVLLAKAYYEMDDREAAREVFSEAVAEISTDEIRGLAVSVSLHYGDKVSARTYAEDIRDPCLRAVAMIRVLRAEGRGEDALSAGRAALDQGCVHPDLYFETAEQLLIQSRHSDPIARHSEALSILTDGAARTQDHERVVNQFARVLYFLCRYDEVIAIAEPQADRRRWAGLTGWAYFRKGSLQEAVGKFTEAIELDPRAHAAYLGRSRCLYLLGDLQGAIADEVQAAAGDPAWEAGRNLRRYYSRETRDLYAPFWDQIDEVCAAAVRQRVVTTRYLGLRALASLYGTRTNHDLALELARQATSAQGRMLAEALGYLGEVHEARGETEDAVRVFERAVALPYCWRNTADDLARLRRELFPRLVTCASVDDYLEVGQRAHLQSVRASLATPALRQYLEARLLEEEGRYAGATELIEGIFRSGVCEEALVLRLGLLRARMRRQVEGLDLIESRFLQPDALQVLWAPHVWLRIARANPPLSDNEIVARLQRLRGDNTTWIDDLIWLEESLRGGAIRINCGGSDHVDSEGRSWGRDRFFIGGRGYARTWPEMSIREDVELYYPQRHFKALCHAVRPGYSIPVPDGRYRVTVWIAETNPWPLPTRFTIEVEGQVVGEKLEGEAVRTLVSKTYDVEVADGSLEIFARPAQWLGWFNAIEVVPSGVAE